VLVLGGILVGGAWLAARPAGEPAADRFGTLLREPRLPADLRADLLATPRADLLAGAAGAQG
jgi:hypothetical protein